jgi:CheY-like chemotaxis protein
MREPAVVAALVGVHVLVADADAETRELLDAVFSYCGAVVTHAESANDALEMVSRCHPDVMVADVAIAGDDAELMRQLRAHGVPAAMPVVAVFSGREHSADRLARAGFSAQLRKPLDPWTLCRSIASLVRKA